MFSRDADRVSAIFSGGVLLLVLLLGVPCFICMPPWCDVTLYDLAARNIRTGGVHYRDIFDTNLPGFVWLLTLIRRVVGPSMEMLRAVDLVIVAGITAVLSLWLRRISITSPRIGWFLVAMGMYYPFSSEFTHVQRDVWMLLPASLAGYLHVRRTAPSAPHWRRGVVIGMLWGTAIWIKPHVVIPAVVLWLATAREVCGSWRAVLRDAAAQITGAVVMGGLGCAWLIATGTWTDFWEIMTGWNPEYARITRQEIHDRWPWKINYFGAWDWVTFLAVPLAVLEIALMRWQRGNVIRRGLAALYLGWYIQALVLQKAFPYVNAPCIILAIAVISARRIPVGLLALLWFGLIGAAWQVYDHRIFKQVPGNALARHALTDPAAWKAWKLCWTATDRDFLRDELAQYWGAHCSTDWESLAEVRRFLQSLDPPLRDGDLICWNDGTHPLYLDLHLKPAIRYMHVGTAWSFESRTEQLAEEIRSTRARYVVSDLGTMTWSRREAVGGDPRDLRLPAWFPESFRDVFPWNQPVVFRSGRYLVHAITQPIGRVEIVPYQKLWKIYPPALPLYRR